MGVRDDYPVVAGIYGSQPVLVYDAHFKPIDSIRGGEQFNVTGVVTGPKHVEYYRLLRSDWDNNGTDRAYVRAATVALSRNPWGAMPHRGRLSSRLRRAVSAVTRRFGRSAAGQSPRAAPH